MHVNVCTLLNALMMSAPLCGALLCILYCTSALSSSRCFWPLSSALICVRHLRLCSSSLRRFDTLSSSWITPYCCFFWLCSSAADSWLKTHYKAVLKWKTSMTVKKMLYTVVWEHYAMKDLSSTSDCITVESVPAVRGQETVRVGRLPVYCKAQTTIYAHGQLQLT